MDLFASLHNVYEAGFLSKLMTHGSTLCLYKLQLPVYKCAARVGEMSNWLHVVGH